MKKNCIQAHFGVKEAVRKTTLMKSLIETAQTMPLYFRENSEIKIPPLVGCIPAGPSYIANV